MEFPWEENATLISMVDRQQWDDQSSIILFEGRLLAIALKVRAMKPTDRRGLRVSLPDRQFRPHTFQDDALSALIESIPPLDR